MQKLNIPTASRKWRTSLVPSGNINRCKKFSIKAEVVMRNYFKEEDVPYSIRTDISVNELSWLELFAEANDLKSMKFGYWEKPSSFFTTNKVCYLMMQPSEQEEANLIYMKLKYGSFESAFDKFRKEISKHQ